MSTLHFHSHRFLSPALALAAMHFAALASQGQTAPLSVVALSGDPAPEAGAGVTFTTASLNFALGVPFMNNSGRVTFLTALSGAGVNGTNDLAIYCGQPGSLSLVAREGAAAPDLPGLNYGTLSEWPLFGGSDAVSFRATIAGAGVSAANDTALFAGAAGTMQLAAREGDTAPGDPGSAYSFFGTSAVSQTTTLAYGGSYTSGVAGLWYGIPGSITSFARVGMPAPGFPAGSTYTAFTGPGAGAGATQVLVNSAGQVAYRGAAFEFGVGIRGAIWGGTPGSTHLVAKIGGEAIGMFGVPLGTYAAFRNPVLTDSGAVAFQAQIGGVPADRDWAIYRTIILGVTDYVIGEGDAAPGTPGGVFLTLDDAAATGVGVPRMNNAHGVAFLARVGGGSINATNDFGIWGHDDVGSLSRLLYESESVSAAGAGVTIGGIASVPPALNGANRIAALVSLAGTGIGVGNDDAILARNGLGNLVIALREGESVDIPGSGSRTIAFLPPADLVVGPGVQNGASTTWTDDCRLLVRAQLNDGRVGLFIADVNATCRASIIDQPDGESIAPGDDATLTAVIEPGFIGGSFRWQRNGEGIIDGPSGASAGSGTVSGSSGVLSSPHDGSPLVLSILGAQASDSGQYRILFTNVCGETSSLEAGLAVAPPPCPGDANGDGAVTFADVTSVLTNFGASYAPGTGPGDANHDGVVNFADVTSVLTNFGAPCP